jgi:ABC-type oligopeptide transport system ATPase subunit
MKSIDTPKGAKEVEKRSNIIGVKALINFFNYEVRTMDGIIFSVDEGEIFGLLGQHGTGKTTIKILITALKLSARNTVKAFVVYNTEAVGGGLVTAMLHEQKRKNLRLANSLRGFFGEGF